MRVIGRANGTPCSPSMTWGPDAPNPSRNRPSETLANVIEVCTVMAALRTPSWKIPDPSSIRSVLAARNDSGVTASAPQASATQAMSTPMRSASRT